MKWWYGASLEYDRTVLTVFFRGCNYILGLFLRCSPSEEIELDFEPFIDFLVDFEILVTNLLGCKAFF